MLRNCGCSGTFAALSRFDAKTANSAHATYDLTCCLYSPDVARASASHLGHASSRDLTAMHHARQLTGRLKLRDVAKLMQPGCKTRFALNADTLGLQAARYRTAGQLMDSAGAALSTLHGHIVNMCGHV